MEAAFFDLDKTIIAKSSVLAFGKNFYREGLVGRRIIMKGIYAQIVFMLVGADAEKMERMRESMLTLTKGWDQAKIASIVRETMEETISPIIFAEALELFDEHHAAGRRVVIVSSAPVEIVTPLVDYLGVDDCIATEAKVDAAGRYTGELAFYAYGPHKAEAIRAYATRYDIDLGASYAYSDSVTDLPMLEVVGHPVVVNADKELLATARERDWEALDFHNPVRLRDRVPTPPPGPTIAVGSVVTAAAAGLAVWWAVRRRAAA
jgi:HAD superfamily hydrolase (TIGR01490 family)